jgi:hypothetical protein
LIINRHESRSPGINISQHSWGFISVKAFWASGKESDIVDFPCIEKSLRRCRKDKISTESLRLRIVRIELPPGKTEVLVSSLTDLKAYLLHYSLTYIINAGSQKVMA